jgi:hypothetical protein
MLASRTTTAPLRTNLTRGDGGHFVGARASRYVVQYERRDATH